MVQRINFDQITNLGSVADPVQVTDAANKRYADSNIVTTLQSTNSPILLGTLFIGAGIAGTDVRIIGDQRALIPVGTTLRFGSTDTNRYSVTGLTFDGATTGIVFEPPIQVSTGVVPAGTQLFYFSSLDAKLNYLRAGTNIVFESPTSGTTVVSTPCLTNVTLVEPSWRSVTSSISGSTETITVTDNQIQSNQVFVGRGATLFSPVALPNSGAATPNSGGTSTIQIVINVTGQTLPGVVANNTTWTISDSALLTENISQIFASSQFQAAFFTSSDWLMTVNASNNAVLLYRGSANPLANNVIPTPSISFVFGGNWTGIINGVQLSLQFITSSYSPVFSYLASRDVEKAISGTPVANQVVGWDGGNNRIQWQTLSSAGQEPLINLGTTFIADSGLTTVKISSTTPAFTVNGTVASVGDFSSITITSSWNPTPAAGQNSIYIAISDSANLNWAGIGTISTSPASITSIAWLRQPPLGAFTNANIYYLTNAAGAVYSSTSVSDAVQNNKTFSGLIFPELTHTTASDTKGYQADVITTQPFIDGRIAAQIGSSSVNSVFFDAGGTANAWVSTGNELSFGVPGLPYVIASFLKLGNVVQNSRGQWQLPATPIYVSLTANPTAAQIGVVASISQVSDSSLLVAITNQNVSYFSGATYPAELYIGQTKFNFQSAPQLEIQRLSQLAGSPPVISLGGIYKASRSISGVEIASQNANINVNGTIDVPITDYSSVSISGGATWPPVIPPTFNQQLCAIADKYNTSWGGVGTVNPIGIDNIAWVKRPLAQANFTDANIYYVNDVASSRSSGVWFSGAGAPTTVSGATFGNYYWDTTSARAYLMTNLVGSVQTWTAQPNLDSYVIANADNEIALKVGASAVPPGITFTNSNGQATSYTSASRILTNQPVSQNLVNNLLSLGNGIVQNATGAWTLPSVSILISLVTSPTASQYGIVTSITQSGTNLQIGVNSASDTYFNGATYPANIFTVLQPFNFLPQPRYGIDQEVRKLRITPALGVSQATYNYSLLGDPGPFTNQVIEAGTNVYFDIDPISNQPRVNAQLPIGFGQGWIFSIGYSPSGISLNAPGWAANTAFPRFKSDGTVVTQTGINTAQYLGATRQWTGGFSSADTLYIAQTYQRWNNSFSDSLQVTTVAVEDQNGRFSIITAIPTQNPTQTDDAVKLLWDLSNPNVSTDHILYIDYDDAGGSLRYQRATAAQAIIADTLQQVLNQGNTANNQTGTPSNVGSISLTDVTVTPNRTATMSGIGFIGQNYQINSATSGNVTLNVPAATTSYTLTLPGAQSNNANNVMYVGTSGIVSFSLPTLGGQIVNNYVNSGLTVASFAAAGLSQFFITGDATTQLAAGNNFAFDASATTVNTVTSSSFDGTRTTVNVFRPLLTNLTSGTAIFTPSVSVTRFNALNATAGLVSQVIGNTLSIGLASGGGFGTLQQILNAGNAASTANSGTASFSLTDIASNSTASLTFALLTVPRIRLTSVGVTGTVDILKTPSANQYTLTLPDSQSNNDNNVLGVSSTGQTSFLLPTLGNLIVTSWTSTGLRNTADIPFGATTFLISGNQTTTILSGDIISFTFIGAVQSSVRSTSYSALSNTTQITLLSGIGAAALANTLIYKAVFNTTQRFNAVNIASGLDYSINNGIMTLVGTGAVGSTSNIQAVLNAGNVASTAGGTASLSLINPVAVSGSVIDSTGVSTPQLIFDQPGGLTGEITLRLSSTAFSPYTLTLPTAQSNSNNNVIGVSSTGQMSFIPPSLALQSFSNWTSTGFTLNATSPVASTTITMSGDASTQLAAGVTFGFSAAPSTRYTSIGASFDGSQTTVQLLAPINNALNAGFTVYLPTVDTATRFNTINVANNLTANVVNGVMSIALSGASITETLQQTLNAGNTASTANSGTASITLSDPTTNVSSTLSPSLLSVPRLRLVAAGVTGFVDFRWTASTNQFVLSLPSAQSNNDNNVIGVNSTGQMSFSLPTVGNVTFSGWVNTGASNNAAILSGVSLFAIDGNQSSSFAIGDTISWSSSGSGSYVISLVSFNIATNTTFIQLYTAVVSLIAANSPIYKGTISTTQRITSFYIANGISSTLNNGVLTLIGSGSGSGGTNFQQALNAGNIASTANSGVANFSLTDSVSNSTASFSYALLTVPRIRLTSVGVTGTVDFITTPSANSYNLSLPSAQSNNDYNVIGVTTAGQMTFTLPTISYLTFSAWVNTGFVNNALINSGAILVYVNGDQTGSFAIGDTISWSSTGSDRYVIVLVFYNVGNDSTVIQLFTSLTVAISANSPIYKGTPSAVQRISTLNIGSGLSSTLNNGVLTLIGVGGGTGTTPNLDQVTAVGSNSSRAITVQNGTFNGLALNIPANQTLGPTVQAIGVAGVANVPLNLQSKGTGVISLATDNSANASLSVSLAPNAVSLNAVGTSASMLISASSVGNLIFGNASNQITIGFQASGITLQASGGNADVQVGFRGKGAGVVSLGNGLNVVDFQFTSTGCSLVPTNTNSDLTLNCSGTGNLYFGNTSSNLRFNFASGGVSITPTTGNSTVSLTLTARGGSSVQLDSNVTLTPLSGGDVFLIGQTLSATAANQPQVIIASGQGSTSVGPGTQGQVFTSNGTNGAPYWATASGGGLQGVNQTLFSITSTAVGSVGSSENGSITTNPPVIATFITRYNNLNLGLATNNGVITGWVGGAIYDVRMTVNLTATEAQAMTTYWCAIRGTQPTTQVSYGDGVTVGVIRQTNNRGRDGVPVEISGTWTPAASSTPLNLVFYTDQLSASNSLSLIIDLRITRVS